MEKMIAVLTGSDGQIISSEDEGILSCFKKTNNGWVIEKEIPFCVDQTSTLAMVRKQIDDIAQSVLPCKIIVATKISGIFYTALEVLGFGIWELEGTPVEVLDKVWEDAVCKVEEESRPVEVVIAELPRPVQVEGEEGKYFFNLMEALKIKGNHTSKRVLMPFFKSGDFNQVEIICDHVPPWFHIELERNGLEMIIVPMPEYYSVIVKKQD